MKPDVTDVKMNTLHPPKRLTLLRMPEWLGVPELELLPAPPDTYRTVEPLPRCPDDLRRPSDRLVCGCIDSVHIRPARHDPELMAAINSTMQYCTNFGAVLTIIRQMAGLQYQAVHIRELVGVSRTDLQRWLCTLPPFNKSPTQARTARTFTVSDLAFFSIVVLLHKELEMPLRTIAYFSAELHALLNVPAASNAAPARYFVNQVDGIWKVGTEIDGSVSLSIDSGPIWLSVYEFVGLELNPQSHLQFGLMAVPSPSVEQPNARRTG